jgi:hypothetical protein
LPKGKVLQEERQSSEEEAILSFLCVPGQVLRSQHLNTAFWEKTVASVMASGQWVIRWAECNFRIIGPVSGRFTVTLITVLVVGQMLTATQAEQQNHYRK